MASVPARGGSAQDAADWIEGYCQFWEESFDRVDDYLRELQMKEKKPQVKEKKHGHKK